MKTLLIAISLVVLGGFVTGAEEAVRLLERADEFRGGFDSFVTRVKLTNYDGDRLLEESEFEVSIKEDNSLVRFLSVRNKGQSLLMRGDDMWFFLPAVARPVRITPVQRLVGNVSNGDMARLRYAVDYDAAIEGDAVVDGQPCTVLDLRAKRRGATYQRIRYFVLRSSGQPVKAEYFLTSGKAIKTATFEGLRRMAGKPILSRIVIHDAGRQESKTVIELLSIAPRPLADKLFSPVRAEG
jgi:outer membrane lipoprotein-sorting protein